MTTTVAILGANGFIGTRLVEYLHLGGITQVRPVVRRVNALAGLSRFDLDCRLADARDQAALERALDGCDVVVHSIAGSPATITGSLDPVYHAAQRAGVRRMIYLSSGSVHGQAPAPGTNESTPLRDDQPLEYNNAKVRAERRLMRLRATGAVELVILRPGIVTGPRSAWIESFASGLISGTAYLVNGGRGICNSIYVDNLARGIHLAMTTAGADGQAFLLADAEAVTFADLYRPIVRALGVDLRTVPEATYQPRRRGWLERIETLRSRPIIGPAIASIPKRVRRSLHAALFPPRQASPWQHPDWSVGARPDSEAAFEMHLLGHCAYKLPHGKARAMLGYEPIVSFDEGMRRTIAWLEFAGYPVDARHTRIRSTSNAWR